MVTLLLANMESVRFMFYFIFVFLLVSVFLLIQNKSSQSTKYFIYSMTAFTVALFSMMFYLSKDTYYYNVVYNYFSLPASIWKLMMFSRIKRDFLILIMNASCLAVLYFSICFVFSFLPVGKIKYLKILQSIIFAVLTLEFLFYMPWVSENLYLYFYPAYLNYSEIQKINEVFHAATVFINSGIILGSVFTLIICYFNASPLRMIRLNIFAVGFCYILIMLSYLFIFGSFPMNLIKVSKLADHVTFLSVPLNLNTTINQLFPYYLIITFILIGYSLYRFTTVIHKINQQIFSLSKEIAASDTTSKVFCHYMKNELLALQWQVEMLRIEEEDAPVKQDILDRFENLYHRLDMIHKSTKTSRLFLTEVNLYEYFEEVLSRLSHEMEGFHVKLKTDDPSLHVMLDANYFEQALHNILMNALDAMRDLPKQRKNLSITISPIHNWIVLMIRDTGIGISKEDLPHIFDPFYSSQPVTKHWGVGLSLTHKIISAHEGYIEAESEPDKGTTIKILLPHLIYLNHS